MIPLLLFACLDVLVWVAVFRVQHVEDTTDPLLLKIERNTRVIVANVAVIAVNVGALVIVRVVR